MSCVFCERLEHPDQLIAQNDLAAAFYDSFPISPGHTLIISKLHETDFLALATSTQSAIFSLISKVREVIEKEMCPHGYNLGVNVGKAAGQTISHAHFHVIPRYEGDVPNPKGGIRWIIPDKTEYWKK